MLPSFHPGDALLVDSKSRRDLSVGHIITFLNGDTMVTHRIVGRSHRGYLAKGDNSYTFDPIVEPGQVVGRVIAIQHGGNWRAVRLSAGSKFVAAASRMDGRFYEVVAGVDQGIGRIIRRFVHGIFKILIRSISVIFSGRERVI